MLEGALPSHPPLVIAQERYVVSSALVAAIERAARADAQVRMHHKVRVDRPDGKIQFVDPEILVRPKEIAARARQEEIEARAAYKNRMAGVGAAIYAEEVRDRVIRFLPGASPVVSSDQSSLSRGNVHTMLAKTLAERVSQSIAV